MYQFLPQAPEYPIATIYKFYKFCCDICKFVFITGVYDTHEQLMAEVVVSGN